MINIFRFFSLAIFFFIAPASAEKTPITLELSVASEFAPFSNVLFESPSYAALAFQNSGIPISLSKPMKILSPKALQIGSERLVFEGKSGNVFRYKASMGLPLGGEISIPVEIDASNLAGGKLIIRAYLSGSGLVPNELIVKVESKMQSLANVSAQKSLIGYLAARTKGGLNSLEGKTQLFDQILWDAVNQTNSSALGSGVCGDVGRAESLSSQWPLIIAVMIWLIGLPVFLYIVRRCRLKKS